MLLQPSFLLKVDFGVGISSISYTPSTGIATATLSVGFSTINSFPFAIGDKILVEGVSVGVGSTEKDIIHLLMIINCSQ